MVHQAVGSLSISSTPKRKPKRTSTTKRRNQESNRITLQNNCRATALIVGQDAIGGQSPRRCVAQKYASMVKSFIFNLSLLDGQLTYFIFSTSIWLAKPRKWSMINRF
jgi:hypothetical protein